MPAKQWQQQIAPLKGKKVISYHSSFRYLFAFTGILVAADLEPKAGMPPTTSHLTSLINLIKQEHITLVVYAPYQQEKPAFWLKEKTGINTLLLPYTIGGHKQSKDLFSLMDNHIELLLAAFND